MRIICFHKVALLAVAVRGDKERILKAEIP
jgi:hypothetical protein